MVDNCKAVTQALHNVEYMRSKEDSGSTVNLLEQDIFHETRTDGIDTLEWFVHQEQLGPVDKRSAHRESLSHTFRVLADELALLLCEFKEHQQFATALNSNI